ncbi:hypothetical protein NX801_18880 [Streptomyces sp. LP05-1]|uniref:Uncharacterized protein n=1 Tax=Streptomyces pyxinae TaxID=2970734 RepID=A0ABT2CJU6_9ACTN|nr:hypothetical protein [Streptomyces sp. LP05-1]MCS0637691.1 hypothetical protein [Streptomyces sp. LP05-1]
MTDIPTSPAPSGTTPPEGADERTLAAAALGCLERCLPLLEPESEGPEDALAPLWRSVGAAGADWAAALTGAGEALGRAAAGDPAGPGALVRSMLAAAPAGWAPGPLREWAGLCSRTALELHRRLEPAGPAGGAGPLTGGELRRQARVRELLAAGPAGLRPAREVSAEGRRVLRAVVARRERGTAPEGG